MLPSLVAAPTMLPIGQGLYLARPLTIEGYGTILRNAGITLGDRDEDGEPLKFADPRVSDWLVTTGSPLLFWLALHRDRPGFTPDDAIALAESATEAEATAVASVCLRRDDLGDAIERQPAKPGGPADLAELDWADVARFACGHFGVGLGDFGRLTVDQIHLAMQKPGTLQENQTRKHTANLMADWYAHWVAQTPEHRATCGIETVPEWRDYATKHGIPLAESPDAPDQADGPGPTSNNPTDSEGGPIVVTPADLGLRFADESKSEEDAR